MTEFTQEIQGKLGHVLYKDETTHYTVARFRLYELNEKTITVTGYFPEFPKDTLIAFEGEYVEHPRYGMQFSVRSYRKILPTEPDSIISFLSSPMFSGIGKKFAKAIVETLGDQALSILKEDPERLIEVPGYSPKKKEAIIEGLIVAGEDEEALRFFTTHGLGIRNILRLERVYGKKAYPLVKENPYRMCDEIDGIGFKTADKVALSMGFEYDDPRRLKAALSALVMELCMSTGDSYVDIHELEYAFSKQFEVDFESLLDTCLVERRLVQVDDKIFALSQYTEERYVARVLREFPYEAMDMIDDADLSMHLDRIQTELNINYDAYQIKAIQNFFHHPFSILTGGPGTGKTTVVGAMIHLWKHLYPSHSLACIAPTGRAAKRLTEINQVQAYTIHSLLKWDLESNTFGKNEHDPLSLDCLIIDEFSMVDTWLFAQLLKASQHVKKILIVGDSDQLPSVAPGNVLANLIESKHFTVLSLTSIYRQQSGSDVITLAHQIRQQHIDFSALSKDIKWFECSAIQAKSLILQTIDKALEGPYTIHDIQVMAPMYSGIVGIDNLNHSIQNLVNPSDSFKQELRIGSISFREGDKILQLKNQPEDDVFNGDIGQLIEVIPASQDENKQNRLVVDFDGRIVEYTAETFSHISLAYCISVHKAQGSEYPIVILPLVKEHQRMLKKRLLYTAVTRASKALLLFGDPKLFEEGILDRSERIRQTCLVDYLIA